MRKKMYNSIYFSNESLPKPNRGLSGWQEGKEKQKTSVFSFLRDKDFERNPNFFIIHNPYH